MTENDPTPDAPSDSAPTVVSAAAGTPPAGQNRESMGSPSKVLRIGSMLRELLEEVRQAPLDPAGRQRMRDVYQVAVRELTSGLSPDLAEELGRIALPLEAETPTEAELRVAQAQLVGWLEGLFHGIQATLLAQQMNARSQLAEIRGRATPGRRSNSDDQGDASPGQYL